MLFASCLKTCLHTGNVYISRCMERENENTIVSAHADATRRFRTAKKKASASGKWGTQFSDDEEEKLRSKRVKLDEKLFSVLHNDNKHGKKRERAKKKQTDAVCVCAAVVALQHNHWSRIIKMVCCFLRSSFLLRRSRFSILLWVAVALWIVPARCKQKRIISPWW